MAWTIEYTDTARTQLRKLDRKTARRIVDYMDKRVAPLDNPRSVGRALTGPSGRVWRYRVGNCRVICDIDSYSKDLLIHMNLAGFFDVH